MPFIHIKSLAFAEQYDISQTLKTLATDFSSKTGIQLDHIHSTWEFFQPGHYAKGDQLAVCQPRYNHPIIVDLLTPDFNDLSTIASMLETIADSLSRQLDFPKQNIFINHRQASSRMVFDDGKIVEW